MRARSAHRRLWHLPDVLQRRGLTPAQFAQMLRDEGHAISDSEVYRLLQYEPLRYGGDLLTAICRTLACELSEVLRYDPSSDDLGMPPEFRVP